MAWSTPSTRATGYKVLATDWDVLVNDLIWLYAAIGSGGLFADRQEVTVPGSPPGAGDCLATNTFVAVIGMNQAVTISLPTSWVTTVGRVVIVKDEAGGAATYPITISGQNSERVDSYDQATINTNWGAVLLYSDGASWHTAFTFGGV